MIDVKEFFSLGEKLLKVNLCLNKKRIYFYFQGEGIKGYKLTTLFDNGDFKLFKYTRQTARGNGVVYVLTDNEKVYKMTVNEDKYVIEQEKLFIKMSNKNLKVKIFNHQKIIQYIEINKNKIIKDSYGKIWKKEELEKLLIKRLETDYYLYAYDNNGKLKQMRKDSSMIFSVKDEFKDKKTVLSQNKNITKIDNILFHKKKCYLIKKNKIYSYNLNQLYIDMELKLPKEFKEKILNKKEGYLQIISDFKNNYSNKKERVIVFSKGYEEFFITDFKEKTIEKFEKTNFVQLEKFKKLIIEDNLNYDTFKEKYLKIKLENLLIMKRAKGRIECF